MNCSASSLPGGGVSSGGGCLLLVCNVAVTCGVHVCNVPCEWVGVVEDCSACTSLMWQLHQLLCWVAHAVELVNQWLCPGGPSPPLPSLPLPSPSPPLPHSYRCVPSSKTAREPWSRMTVLNRWAVRSDCSIAAVHPANGTHWFRSGVVGH